MKTTDNPVPLLMKYLDDRIKEGEKRWRKKAFDKNGFYIPPEQRKDMLK